MRSRIICQIYCAVYVLAYNVIRN